MNSKLRENSTVEIGIIITVILLAFAFALGRTAAGVVIVELAKLLWSALVLASVVLAALILPKRPVSTS